jgi:superfamily I DNA/RNA helicase/CRISPR/Cas system-associated exonuclease Cas4 (RecB family)
MRLGEARAFVDQFMPGDEVLLLGASRGAVDDFARAIALEKGATFGLHRLSFTQLAARLAALQLASTDRAPATSLGHEAVATRAAFEANRAAALEYFAPVAATPGFPKALARTLLELRLSGASGDRLSGLSRSGPDLAELVDRVDLLMREAGASDRASLFETATQALRSSALNSLPSALGSAVWPVMPALLLDVPFDSEAEAQFLWALIQRSPKALITIPSGDSRTIARLGERGVTAEIVADVRQTDLGHLTRYLFSPEPPPERSRSGELVWFSAPGEGRECVEIARRLLKEAARGVRFDEMAILVRSPQQYLGVLEHALGRAKIPAYFDRGTRRPHPAGRAFLALLSCAVERFSARRFAEYLSLAQVPDLDADARPQTSPEATWVASSDEVFGVASDEAAKPATKPAKQNARSMSANALLPFDEPPANARRPTPNDQRAATSDQRPVTSDQYAAISGTLRAPWRWESLLVESAVIGGAARWSRRLNGLDKEYELKIRALRLEEPDSPRIARLERERRNLAHLRAFALPLIESMAAWPASSSWGDWLQRLEGLVPRVLRVPEDVLGVLADLRPMGAVGPVGLTEVRDVLADRLMSLEVDPPANRYGRVFIGSPHQARGRAFRAVFVPGLAERLFPQKLREDPLLLDDLRRDLAQVAPSAQRPAPRDHRPETSDQRPETRDQRPETRGQTALPVQEDRADLERLLLRLAVGAATERLYVSFPRIETAEARQRVPSFYALEVMRAVTGRIPDHQALETEAAEEAKASLSWPAPVAAQDAIDDFEHDLSVLRVLMRSTDDVKGHAHYMLRLNDCLRRSATERWARSKSQWSQFDGIVRVTDGTRAFLQTQRLGERPYSVSALQNYAYCPYRFLLSAIYKLERLEEPEPLQRLDPLTKGSLFHEVQAEFFRALQRDKKPIDITPIEAVLAVLDATLTRIAAKYAEEVAPAVERVWQDEIAAMRTDLHVWARNLADGKDWEPWLFEYAFGLPNEALEPGAHAARDPNSITDPVKIDGRFLLRGSIDLVERRRPIFGAAAQERRAGPATAADSGAVLRVTDHKTSKNRSERRSIIGGGQQLQPVIYSLAVEAATGCTVETARFSYCTSAGGFTEHTVSINDMSRRVGIVAMEIIDRAIDLGMMPPAPAERACRFCDFLTVCGPEQERRVMRKSKQQIADLLALRGEP